MKVVLDESGFGMKVVLDELVFYPGTWLRQRAKAGTWFRTQTSCHQGETDVESFGWHLAAETIRKISRLETPIDGAPQLEHETSSTTTPID